MDEHIVYGCISMPSNVFANTGTNVSVLFFDNSRKTDKVVLIDASKLGEEYKDGNNQKRRLRDFEIDKIVDTFLNKEAVDDFSVAVTYDEIKEKKYSLAAGQYFDVKIEYVELSQDERYCIRLFLGTVPSSMPSTYPLIIVIGVRSSWETLETNCFR